MTQQFKIWIIIIRCLAAVYFATTPVAAQFTNITSQIGDFYTTPMAVLSGGVSFADINGDGWDDLSIGLGTQGMQIFLNDQGTLVPTDLINTPTGAEVSMLLWADYDNDGDRDLLITKRFSPLELWRNDNGIYTNVAAVAGLEIAPDFYAGAAFADYDHDGCLDLYITKFYDQAFSSGQQYHNILYRSNCDGTFTDVTQEAGVNVLPSLTFQPVFFDYNNDGWEDLYLINELSSYVNHLFRNNGDGTFTDVSETTGAGIFVDAMTGTVGDFNNNGMLDVFVSNRLATGGNHLMVAQSDGTYINQAEAHGLGTHYASYGALWLDYNNNGWQDLFVSIPNPASSGEPGNAFYVNHQGTGFTNEREALGFGADMSRTYVTARGDLQNDGYYDLAHHSRSQTPFQLFANLGGDNNYISVTLQGTLANRDGIGSWIKCYSGDQHTVHFTMCGENFLGQNSYRYIFGLDTLPQVDSLVIEWNSGTREVYLQPAIHTHHHFIEGASFTQPFALSYSGSDALCPGDSLVLHAPDNQSYLWNTGDTTQSITVSQAGTYYVEAWNAFGLSAFSDTIVVTEVPQAQVQFEVQHVSCAGAMDGSIVAQISTGPLQEIIWNTGATDTLIQQLGSGIYSFTALDSAGCAVSGETSLSEPSPLVAQAIITHVLCFGDSTGTAHIEALGGTPPYSAEWNNDDPDALPAGNYTIVITDTQNCEVAIDFDIDQPDSLWVTFETGPANGGDNGWVNAQAFGGTPPYEWLWSTGESGVSEINNLAAGNYSLTLTDAHNCELTDSLTITNTTGLHRDAAQRLRLFPNPTHHDAILEGCSPGAELLLFDVFGHKILRQRIASCPFTIRTNGLPAGQYLLKVNSGNASQHLRLVVVN